MNHKPVFCYWYKGNLYVSLTNRCTLACTFCPKRSGDFTFRGLNLRLSLNQEPTVEQVTGAINEALDGGRKLPGELVFAGLGEPTTRLAEALDVARWFKQLSFMRAPSPPVRLITDGLANLRNNRDVTGDLVGSIDVISVSLNAGDPATYANLCPSSYGTSAYGAMLDFIRLASEKGLRVVASVVDPVPGVDVEACRRVIGAIPGAELRVREYEPDGFVADAAPDLNAEIAEDYCHDSLLKSFAMAVNHSDMDTLGKLLSPDVAYEAVLAGYGVQGADKVAGLLKMGIEQHSGKSRLGLGFSGTLGQGLIWWEPVGGTLVKRGFLTFDCQDGKISSIRDSHDPDEVAAAIDLTSEQP